MQEQVVSDGSERIELERALQQDAHGLIVSMLGSVKPTINM